MYIHIDICMYVNMYASVCTYIYMRLYIYMYTCINKYLLTYLYIYTLILVCIRIEASFSHARALSPFLPLCRTLSLSLSLSLSVTFFLCFTLSLFLAPFTHARHNTTLTRATNSSHAPCAHYQWREKPTPRVRRGFESQSRHVSHLAHNVRSCNGHIWSHLLAESKSERARIRSASFVSRIPVFYIYTPCASLPANRLRVCDLGGIQVYAL